MGQYYKALILAEKPVSEEKEFTRAAVSSFAFNSGSKLIEHSYIGEAFMSAVEFLLSPLGMFYKSRLVWAGDYADPEPGYGPDSEKNLYSLCESKEYMPNLPIDYCEIMQGYNFIVNHTKKLFINKAARVFHPLSLLTAEGNGRGGGDYHGSCEDLVGTWARDVISVEMTAPAEYTELASAFGQE